MERGHQIALPALFIGFRQVLVRAPGQLVLGFTGNAPLGGGDRLVLAHGQAGARLAVLGDVRDHQLGVEQLDRLLELVTVALGAVDLHENLAGLLVDAQGRVRGGVHTTGHGAVHLAEGDLVGHQDGRFQAGAAGLLQVVGGGFRRQLGAQHALAHQVEVLGVLHHGAGGHFTHALAVEFETIHQAVERGGQHFLVVDLEISGIGAGKGNAVAAHNGHLAYVVACQHSNSSTVASGRPEWPARVPRLTDERSLSPNGRASLASAPPGLPVPVNTPFTHGCFNTPPTNARQRTRP